MLPMVLRVGRWREDGSGHRPVAPSLRGHGGPPKGLTLSVQSGGKYSLRVHPGAGDRGQEAAGRDLVALGVLGAEEVVSMVPG